MAATFNPSHPGGFAAVALIAFLVTLIVLPTLDRIFSAAGTAVA